MIKILFLSSITVVGFTFMASASSITINPIQVCDDNGKSCAPVNLYKSFTDKIYQQVDTTITYGPTKQLNSSKYLNPSLKEASRLRNSTILGGTKRSLFAYDAWFVDTIDNNPGFRGLGTVNGDGMVVASSARVDTFAHELGHNLNLVSGTSSGKYHVDEVDPKTIDKDRFLMAGGGIRTTPSTLADIAPDGNQLSRIDAIFPEVTIDMIGSTPFQSNSFFNVNFVPGAADDLGLKSLKLDLSAANAFFDITNSPPGLSSSQLGFDILDGILGSDITVSGLQDGGSILELMFAEGSFTTGDKISFGLDIDLFSNIDGFGATADELRATAATFDFENGYQVSGDLSTLIFTSEFDPNRNVDRIGGPLADAPSPIPLPSAIFFLLGGLGMLTAIRKSA